ncbi:helix-turn-helix domain-containing protein [Streptomyces sp. NPDC059611]|uniref:helix-turn-helix domain-containing protein n=1 Tax=Streptomyces sp. NPDC059611 TaxID=3346884 RepID=UPI0036CDA08F
MRAQSRVSQRVLAGRMRVDLSYVSRILSGERDASWQHVLVIYDLPRRCRPDEAPVGDGRERATQRWRPDPLPPHLPPGPALHRRLPPTRTILASTQNTITAADLRQALEGPGTPTWLVARTITDALWGLPDLTLPLWRSATTRMETLLPAEALG